MPEQPATRLQASVIPKPTGPFHRYPLHRLGAD